MNYLIVSKEWLAARNILPLPTMRKNSDGTKYLIHDAFFMPFSRGDEEETKYGGAVSYPHNSPQLLELLASDEWNGEDAPSANTADYVQVAGVRNLMQATKANIQSYALTDNENLSVMDLYPEWGDFVGGSLQQGFKVVHGGKLYRVRQDVAVVLENQPPSIYTAALYEEINETHEGTQADPIPYNNNMELEQGKYYTQGGVTYYCHTGSGQAVYNDLADLAVFVSPVENGYGGLTL